MGTDAHVFFSDLTRGLAPRADQVGDMVLQHLLGDLPELWKYEDIAAVAPVALSEHIAAALDFLERGPGMTEVRTPPTAIEFARRLAEHGVPISELLRVYRLVHAGLLDQLYEETARVAGSQELVNATTLTLSAMAFEYADRTAEQAVAAYQRERDRWLQRRLIVINEAGTRIGTRRRGRTRWPVLRRSAESPRRSVTAVRTRQSTPWPSPTPTWSSAYAPAPP
jgi:hypothetical protein